VTHPVRGCAKELVRVARIRVRPTARLAAKWTVRTIASIGVRRRVRRRVKAVKTTVNYTIRVGVVIPAPSIVKSIASLSSNTADKRAAAEHICANRDQTFYRSVPVRVFPSGDHNAIAFAIRLGRARDFSKRNFHSFAARNFDNI